MPKTVLKVCEPVPNSGTFVLPIGNRARHLQPIDDEGIFLRHEVTIDGGAKRGADPFGKSRVLMSNRQAVKRAHRDVPTPVRHRLPARHRAPAPAST